MSDKARIAEIRADKGRMDGQDWAFEHVDELYDIATRQEEIAKGLGVEL